MAKTTEELENELKSIHTTDQLEDWMDENYKGECRFCDYFAELCSQKGIKPGNLVGKIALSKPYIYNLAKGEKLPSKEAVIKIALGLHASVEETNRLLKLSGNKELYPKKEEDAVVEYGIRNNWTVYQIDELLKKRGLEMSLTDKE